MFISCYLMRPNAKAPNRAHPDDAGLDVFYCPDLDHFSEQKGNNVELLGDNSGIIIHPGGNFMFPTGIVMGIPHGFALFVCNRGSMGAKKSLIYGAHVIDSGYEGEIFIDLHNIGINSQDIKVGDKIAQLVLLPVLYCEPLIAKNKEQLYETYPIVISSRGQGKLGSTGR